MAVDMFLKIDDIKGESVDRYHPDEIHIESFSWGASNPGSFDGGGGGSAGKVSFSDLSLSKWIDKTSPLLMKGVASGKHFQKVELFLRLAGARLDFYKITLQDVLVSSVQQGGSSGDDRPMESLSLNFARVEATYTPGTDGKSPGEPVMFSWDLRENRP